MPILRWLFAGLLATGCQAVRDDQPPRIRYGREACEACRMLISEPTVAAAARVGTRDIKKFDEVGCLMQYLAAHPGSVTQVWVQDYGSGRWLTASESWFVHSQELATPMGYGIVAVAARDEAEQLAQRLGGALLRYEELPRVISTGGTS